MKPSMEILRVLGLLVFLASEFLMFAGFFATFLIFRSTIAEWPPEGTEVELLLPAINTVILVSSSLVINFGTKAIKKNDLAGMRLWFGITAAMGAIFLGGQFMSICLWAMVCRPTCSAIAFT